MPSDEMVEKAVNAFVQVMAQAWGEGDALLDAQRAGMRAALAAAEAGEPVALTSEDEASLMRALAASGKEIPWQGDYTPVTIRAGTVASPPSEASRDERETASPGPWPTEAEYELWQNDEFAAGASGSPEDAARQIMHYAAVYGQDGPVKIYEVKRYEVSPDALATAIRAMGET